MKKKAVAFIPARSSSKRIPHKNIKLLRGHPLLAYSIRSAIESGVFHSVICATDSQDYADIALHYGAQVPFLRPSTISGDKSPDIDWVLWALEALHNNGISYDIFSILRPTSPFRSADTIRRAYEMFYSNPTADSLRAIEKCKQHPGKMWMMSHNRIVPLMPFYNDGTPWHSSQYAALPEIYVQNASLEIAWTRVALQQHSIAGSSVIPFISQGLEGFDINDAEDWLLAEHYVDSGQGVLPHIKQAKYFTENL